MAGDEQGLREALRRAAEPPGTSGAFDEIARRRVRYRLRKRVGRAMLVVVVIAGAGAATWTLARSFGLGTSRVATPPPATAPATGPAPYVPPPTAPVTSGQPSPPSEADCRQSSSVQGDFDGDGAAEVARLQRCGDGWFLDIEHPGRIGPVPRWAFPECRVGCTLLAAPDVNADGTDELAVVPLAFTILDVVLFDASDELAGPVVITVAAPGDPAGQFEPGRPARLGFGGDAFSAFNVRCETRAGARVMVATAAESLPHDRVDARWHVHETVLRFAAADDAFHVVSVDAYTLPTGGPEDQRLFADNNLFCGAPTAS
jgi:hypothetical protein